jgi:hypothetical protein
MDSICLSELPPELRERLSPARKVRLSAEILATYCLVRVRLVGREFPTALTALRSGDWSAEPPPRDAVTHLRAARLAWAVRRTLKFVPTDSRCLMQSLVLTVILARRGIDSSLLIGVKPGGDFEAHAWLEYCGRPLLPDGSDDAFHVLTRL